MVPGARPRLSVILTLTMVNWHSPTQLARDTGMSVSYLLENRLVYHNAEAFFNFIHILFGLYL